MNDDAFARLVAEEIKNNVSQTQRDYLNLPENWARWQRAIKSLADNLESQIKTISQREQEEISKYENLDEDVSSLITELTAEFENRRRKIERFRFHVINRLDDVTRMIALGTDQVEERLRTVEFLRKAIETHKSMMRKYELEPTPIDAALWMCLDGRWGFDDLTEEKMIDFLDE